MKKSEKTSSKTPLKFNKNKEL